MLVLMRPISADDVGSDIGRHYQPPPRVHRDMADKFKSMPGKPNYKADSPAMSSRTQPAKAPKKHKGTVAVVLDANGDPLAESSDNRAHREAEEEQEAREAEAAEMAAIHAAMEAARDRRDAAEHAKIEEGRREAGRRAVSEFRRRVERIRSTAALAFRDDHLELTKIRAELEVLKKYIFAHRSFARARTVNTHAGVPRLLGVSFAVAHDDFFPCPCLCVDDTRARTHGSLQGPARGPRAIRVRA